MTDNELFAVPTWAAHLGRPLNLLALKAHLAAINSRLIRAPRINYDEFVRHVLGCVFEVWPAPGGSGRPSKMFPTDALVGGWRPRFATSYTPGQDRAGDLQRVRLSP